MIHVQEKPTFAELRFNFIRDRVEKTKALFFSKDVTGEVFAVKKVGDDQKCELLLFYNFEVISPLCGKHKPEKDFFFSEEKILHKFLVTFA